MASYTIFTRRWWRDDPNNKGKLLPNPGARRTVIDTANTREEAVEKCHKYNEKNPPGKYSVKAEFTSSF